MLSDGRVEGDATRRAGVAGTYTLHSVNGQHLPTAASDMSERAMLLVGGSVVLREDGSYTASLHVRTTPVVSDTPQEGPIIDHGTYVLRRNRLSVAGEDHRRGFLGFMEEDVERVLIQNGTLIVSVRAFRPLFPGTPTASLHHGL